MSEPKHLCVQFPRRHVGLSDFKCNVKCTLSSNVFSTSSVSLSNFLLSALLSRLVFQIKTSTVHLIVLINIENMGLALKTERMVNVRQQTQKKN